MHSRATLHHGVLQPTIPILCFDVPLNQQLRWRGACMNFIQPVFQRTTVVQITLWTIGFQLRRKLVCWWRNSPSALPTTNLTARRTSLAGRPRGLRRWRSRGISLSDPEYLATSLLKRLHMLG